MRMRRLELAILAITLAFAFFMGGFFAGRSHSAVNVTATAAKTGGHEGVQISAAQQSPPATVQTSQSADTVTATASPDSNAQSHTDNSNTDDSNTSQGTGAPKDNDGRININTATHGELTDLPGVGDAIASRIIDYRQQNGSFARIEDIQNVSGIGERKFAAMKDMITVG